MVENFENLLEIVGGWGKWQIRTLLLTSLAGFAGAIHDFLHIFLAATPNHWCHLQPPCSSLSYEELKVVAIPTITQGNEYSKCSQYKYYTVDSGSQQAADGACEIHRSSNETTGCGSLFDFDRETFHETIVTEWNLVCEEEAWASMSQTVFFLGGLVGSLLFGLISDNYGRKTAVVAAACLSLLSGPTAALAPSFKLYVGSRFFLACGTSALFSTAYVLVLENVMADWRGFVGGMMEIPYALGQASTAVFGYYFRNWRHLHLVVMLPILIFLCVMYFVDESPRWLVSRGEGEKGETILRKIAECNGKGDDEIPDKFDHIVQQLAIRGKEHQKGTESVQAKVLFFTEKLVSLVRTPEIRRRSLALYFCWFAVSMVFNGGAFIGANLTSNVFLYVFINGLLGIPASVLVPGLLKCVGRRTLFSGFFFLSATALISCFLFPSGSHIFMALSWLGVGFSMGAAYIVVYAYASELFPTTLRSCGIGVATFLAKGGAVCGLYCAQMLGTFNKMAPSLVLGFVAFVAGFAVLLLPETSNRRMAVHLKDVENDSASSDGPSLEVTPL